MGVFVTLLQFNVMNFSLAVWFSIPAPLWVQTFFFFFFFTLLNRADYWRLLTLHIARS